MKTIEDKKLTRDETDTITVTYFHRKPRSQYFSIERVFDTVCGALPPGIRWRNVYSSYGRGFLGRLYNIVEATFRQSQVNHITGDVHYLAFGLSRKRSVLTVHDCRILERLGGWRRDVIRLLWYEWPIRRAGVVTAISESTKAALLRHTNCPESKIVVIPNPIPPGFDQQEKVFCAREPVLLQVGTFDNKNLENVARSLKDLKCRLSIIGHLSQGQSDVLEECGILYRADSDLSNAEVLERYRDADIVLFCSTYEGFGMPIIEANSLGRPVVASDIEPLRTIAGGAACLVNPHSSDSIRAGILRVIEDADYRGELIRRGFANAKRFQPEGVARLYVQVYRDLLADSGHSR